MNDAHDLLRSAGHWVSENPPAVIIPVPTDTEFSTMMIGGREYAVMLLYREGYAEMRGIPLPDGGTENEIRWKIDKIPVDDWDVLFTAGLRSANGKIVLKIDEDNIGTGVKKITLEKRI